MATTRTAVAHWEGSLFEGAGKVTLESSGIGTYDVSWPARSRGAERQDQPRGAHRRGALQLLLMALSLVLDKAGNPPTSLDTTAKVTFQPGTGITGSRAVRRRQRPRHHRRAVRGGGPGRQGQLPGEPGAQGPDHAGDELHRLRPDARPAPVGPQR